MLVGRVCNSGAANGNDQASRMAIGRLNISRVASKLVREHGNDAPLVARLWARCADRAGDPNRHSAWCQIENLVCKIVSCGEVTRKLEDHRNTVEDALKGPTAELKNEPPSQSARSAE